MRRVDDYRQNAEACRQLAGEMTGDVREHLLSMAREWDHLAGQLDDLSGAEAAEGQGTPER